MGFVSRILSERQFSSICLNLLLLILNFARLRVSKDSSVKKPQVGLSWAILASSWELLGNMLGLRWTKMA